MNYRFGGEIAGFYQQYRRGYPPAAVDALCATFTLTGDDVVVDLGCGTGQLTVPMAEGVRAVVGMDLSPDMVETGRRVAMAAGVANVSWLLGGDTDIPALGAWRGGFGAVTIAQALHWMDHEKLFADIRPMLRAGGGVAVVTNGLPLWFQESSWSHALRKCSPTGSVIH
ncbi:class I SAM-dependent methyltransferase [Amycolatopsis jiangsuensis]